MRDVLDAYKPNSVVDSYLSKSDDRSSDQAALANFAIGARPCIQVRILRVSAGLNRVVSVLISRIAPDRRYLLPSRLEAHVRLEATNVRTFLSTEMEQLSGIRSIIPHFSFIYNTSLARYWVYNNLTKPICQTKSISRSKKQQKY